MSSRFIPTGVGNTAISSEALSASAVHPHGCGEHRNYNYLLFSPLGSSPRVWGTLDTRAAGVSERRFIPTGVGNTCLDEGEAAHRAVHPHGCGEHVKTVFMRSFMLGSSPRVWGTR